MSDKSYQIETFLFLKYEPRKWKQTNWSGQGFELQKLSVLMYNEFTSFVASRSQRKKKCWWPKREHFAPFHNFDNDCNCIEWNMSENYFESEYSHLRNTKNFHLNTYFGSILKIFDPPHVATYKLPSASIVIPSGTNPGFLPFALKSMTTRSFARKD